MVMPTVDGMDPTAKEKIESCFPGHDAYFFPFISGYFMGRHVHPREIQYGNMLLIRKGIVHDRVIDWPIFGEPVRQGRKLYGDEVVPRNMILSTIGAPLGPNLIIGAFHGLHVAGTYKRDIPERRSQSAGVVDGINAYDPSRDAPILLMGDFNLRPSELPLGYMQVQLGLMDLVSLHKYKSTRTKHYERADAKGNTLFADYMLLSPRLQYRDFVVDYDVPSDHAALSIVLQL